MTEARALGFMLCLPLRLRVVRSCRTNKTRRMQSAADLLKSETSETSETVLIIF